MLTASPQPFEETAMQTTLPARSGRALSARIRSIIPDVKWCLAVLLAIGLWIPQASAQFGSSVGGTVLDPTGAAIPNAKVVLTNVSTQQVYTQTTNATGF
jgi:hypothetical protein